MASTTARGSTTAASPTAVQLAQKWEQSYVFDEREQQSLVALQRVIVEGIRGESVDHDCIEAEKIEKRAACMDVASQRPRQVSIVQ